MKTGLVQVNAPFSGQNYLPLSVASLWSYFRVHGQHADSFELGPVIYRREGRAGFEAQVTLLADCDLVAASLYTWNERYTLELLRRVRQVSPRVVIVAGGPQVPDAAGSWLGSHPFVDVAVHGEGEATFAEIADTIASSISRESAIDLSNIPGTTVKSAGRNGGASSPVSRPRFKDLDLPSPFLDGTFDEIMARYPNESWMVLWETNRGCPFSCTFCDWGSATNGKVSRFPLERLKSEIEWIATNQIEFVFTCDANFGLLPRDVDLAHSIEDVVARTGFPKRVSTQGAKNVTERSLEVQTILTRAGVSNGAALSMQSLHPPTLSAIKRDNISLDAYWDLQQRYRMLGVPTYVDLILGLPMETCESFMDGVGQLLEYGQHDHIQFNNLSLLPNAAMSSREDRAKYEYDIVKAPVRAVHGSARAAEEDVTPEFQELVVGTNTMRGLQWRYSRTFAWFVALAHLNKLVQIHLILTRSLTDYSYPQIFQHLMEADQNTPAGAVVKKLMDFAQDTQFKGVEYFSHPHCLDIYWTADEYMLIDLVYSGELENFVLSVQERLSGLVNQSVSGHDPALLSEALHDATRISLANLMLPGVTRDAEVLMETNAVEVVESSLRRESRDLVRHRNVVTIRRTGDRELVNMSFEDWARKVVWFRNKRGAYTYSDSLSNLGVPAGHFR